MDHEEPISVGADLNTKRIYALTAAGLFTVFDLMSFNVIYQRDFKEVSNNMISYRLSERVMIIFENGIAVLDANSDNNSFDEL